MGSVESLIALHDPHHLLVFFWYCYLSWILFLRNCGNPKWCLKRTYFLLGGSSKWFFSQTQLVPLYTHHSKKTNNKLANPWSRGVSFCLIPCIYAYIKINKQKTYIYIYVKKYIYIYTLICKLKNIYLYISKNKYIIQTAHPQQTNTYPPNPNPNQTKQKKSQGSRRSETGFLLLFDTLRFLLSLLPLAISFFQRIFLGRKDLFWNEIHFL